MKISKKLLLSFFLLSCLSSAFAQYPSLTEEDKRKEEEITRNLTTDTVVTSQ